MFLYRLKCEFSENLKLLIVLWLMIAVMLWSFWDWWSAPLGDSNSSYEIGEIALLVMGVLVFFLVSLIFKRDDLKSPRDFLATRPIRSRVIFGAKLCLLLLAVVLPISLSVGLAGLIAGIGYEALFNALEVALWMTVGISLISLSCMAFEGGRNSLACIGGFFAGLFIPMFVLRLLFRYMDLEFVTMDSQIAWNVLCLLFILGLVFTLLCLRQLGDKHRYVRPSLLVAAGFLTTVVGLTVPIPGSSLLDIDREISEVLPAVTRIEKSQRDMNFGRMNGKKSVAIDVLLIPDELIRCNVERSFSDWASSIVVEAVDGVPITSHWAGYEVAERFENGEESIRNIRFSLRVHEQQPTNEKSSSWEEKDLNRQKVVEALPKRKVRITGHVMIPRIKYRELHRGPIDEGFLKKENEVSVGYLPDASEVIGNYSSLKTIFVGKKFSLPLLTARKRNVLDAMRVRIINPHDVNDHNDYFVSHMVQYYSLYGSMMINMLDDPIDLEWQRRQDEDQTLSISKWKRDTELIFEVPASQDCVKVPINAEVEIPDPVKIRELMLKGEL